MSSTQITAVTQPRPLGRWVRSFAVGAALAAPLLLPALAEATYGKG